MTCPYCNGKSRKIRGRVARQPSHLSYGYGERQYRCSDCGEIFLVCYPVPPKRTSGYTPSPHKAMLKVSFREGVSGYANPCVLTAPATEQPNPSGGPGSRQQETSTEEIPK